MITRVRKFVPVVVALILLQSLLGGTGTSTGWLTKFVTYFVAILLEAMPFMLIGSIVSGTIEVLLPRELIAKWMPKNRYLAVLLFGLLGMVFPICDCGVVPIIRRLLRKGVPLSCAITYLLAAPIVQPIVIAATLVAFNGNLKIALLRVLGGYIVAVAVGLLSISLLDPKSKEHVIMELAGAGDHTETRQEPEAELCCCHEHGHAHHHDEHEHEHGRDYNHGCSCGCEENEPADSSLNALGKMQYVLLHAKDDFLSTGSYLIFGAFLAAGMQAFVSQEALSSMGKGVLLGPLVMMAMAFCLSLCSEADAFVAAAFTQFSMSARMAFLVMGPMVDIKLVAMYNGFLSRKATCFIFGTASALALIYALVMRLVGV